MVIMLHLNYKYPNGGYDKKINSRIRNVIDRWHEKEIGYRSRPKHIHGEFNNYWIIPNLSNLREFIDDFLEVEDKSEFRFKGVDFLFT